MVPLTAVLEQLGRSIPLSLAAEWDNVGLLLGDRDKQVKKIMTCLTVTPASAKEAAEEQADLIVTHHPVMFRPIQRLTTGTPEGQVLLALATARIAVYSPHTAFDNARGGINDSLAARLGLTDVVPLRQTEDQPECKLVAFVPADDLAKVSDALFAAGAGHIGEYRECSFRLAGTGTFFGSESTTPTVGTKGRREEVSEWRLEMICPRVLVDRAIAALRQAHSYEEPAFDIYPLQSHRTGPGTGRVGKLPIPLPLADLAVLVKQSLPARHMQVVGAPQRKVERVAIVCGAGGELLGDAIRAKADVLLTGEMRFHDYLAAQAQDIALLLPGHYATERPGVEELAGRLQRQWPQLQVWASRQERDPAIWI
jgi:dinuclear metal center YbgI/SA1388 family protein